LLQYDSNETASLHSVFLSALLAAFWLFGVCCGILLFLYAGTPMFFLMRRLPYGSVSIVSLLVTGLIPFLFSAFAVFISRPRMILAVSFCRACLYSFVSLGVSVAFASAGWLIRGLLLFYNSFSCVMLFFLSLRILSGGKVCWLAVIAAVTAANGASFCIISPFLACLIEH